MNVITDLVGYEPDSERKARIYFALSSGTGALIGGLPAALLILYQPFDPWHLNAVGIGFCLVIPILWTFLWTYLMKIRRV